MNADTRAGIGTELDFNYVDGSFREIHRAVQGGVDGCKRALQVLRALKAYLTTFLAARALPAEAAMLQQLVHQRVQQIRDAAETEHDELLLSVLSDLERMTLKVCTGCKGRETGDGDGGEEYEGTDRFAAMDADVSSVTVICEACGDAILGRRMQAHVEFWCGSSRNA